MPQLSSALRGLSPRGNAEAEHDFGQEEREAEHAPYEEVDKGAEDGSECAEAVGGYVAVHAFK